jgi:hypothetical protein
MALIVLIVVWIGTIVPLLLLPVNSGGWLLVAIFAGLITAYFGAGGIALGGLGSSLTSLVFGIVGAIGGGGLFLYALVTLVSRGAGIHIDVSQT